MCGIAGQLFHDPTRRVDPAAILRMTDTIRHRGPDDGGVWTDGSVGLGSRRLAVIDLSPRGHMPMTNEDGSLHVVFNGEIYNFHELRDELRAKGHVFRSDSDTEAILHLWEEYGERLVERLRGMFAFALWDASTRTLFAARDRLGKKPLYYVHDAHGFVFGSEPKALLQAPGVEAGVDLLSIHHYLTWGYVPSPFSAFRGMRKLPPAHSLTVRGGRLDVRRYWTLRYGPKHTASEDRLAEELQSLLEESVRLRLISDVPLGALLSGGVDSSAIVATMRRLTSGPVRTFSIGFDQPAYDELAYARLVAQHFGTEHHELVVKPDAAAILPKLVWYYNEPYADSSALPAFQLCAMARRSVTVALAGDGGDELFAGYDRHAATAVAARFDVVPAPLRAALARGVGALGTVGAPKTLVYRLARFVEGLPLDPVARYARWLAVFDNSLKLGLYTADFAAQVASHDSLELLADLYRRSDAEDFVEATLDADLQMYLPDDLLVKMDIASMACSLEVRSPLLDHHLVEFAARLPRRMKLRGLVQKHLLKRVMHDVLPEPILARRKMGFGVPIDNWLRGELRETAYDVLLDRRAIARGYFRADALRRLLDEHASGAAFHHHRLWALLMLELWHRTFIDDACPLQAPSADDVRTGLPRSVVAGAVSL
ncbi:asparagine synthase (glutamine-hydrolyzing) [Candidatus Binatia bacterium]|nr:asparagine synthase (glutamine-hydrolyzing) [Candidatus Binatia bacterium]